MERIFIGLGSNLADREENLRGALRRIAALPGTRVVRTSSFFHTAPWGFEEQPPFVNAVAELASDLEPEALLEQFQQIERDLGRVPTFKWGPRLIDIDLLLFGERTLKSDRLNLPHPHILSRPFVWEPLREIAPEVLEELRRAAVSL